MCLEAAMNTLGKAWLRLFINCLLIVCVYIYVSVLELRNMHSIFSAFNPNHRGQGLELSVIHLGLITGGSSEGSNNSGHNVSWLHDYAK